MQIKYKQHFKNARQHIIAVPPLSDRQIELNWELQKLANETGSCFVSTKAFRDYMTGHMRFNLMEKNNSIHYNHVGVKHLALAIKKSLFSEHESDDPGALVRIRQQTDAIRASTTQNESN